MLNYFEIDPKIKVKLDDLIEEPVIVRVNKFNEDALKEFSKSFDEAHSTGQPIIPVVVDSFGGSVYALLNFITIIQNSLLPVATICESKAMSAGAILFSFGKEGYRFMAPHATLMIHEVSSGCWGKVKELKEDVKETERLNNLIFNMMAQNLGKPENYFLDLIHEKSHADWYLTAQDCKEHGITNHIRVPKLKTIIKVEMELI